MGLLWAGGESLDFPFTSDGLEAPVTDNGQYRAGYARTNIRPLIMANTDYMRSDPFSGGAVTSAWLHWWWRISGNIVPNKRLIGLVKASSGSKGIYVGPSDTARKLALFSWDGSTQVQLAKDANTTLPSSQADVKIDVEIINFGASATVKVYVDSAEIISYSGDLSGLGISDLDAVAIWGTSSLYDHYMAEVIVHTSDTRLMSLVTQYPNAAGDSNAWTGAYTDIDENNRNDADYIYTDANAQAALFNLSNLPGSIPDTVIGCRIAVRALKTADASVGNLKLGAKSDGTIDIDGGRALTTSWATYERIMETINGGSFDQTKANALQIALESLT